MEFGNLSDKVWDIIRGSDIPHLKIDTPIFMAAVDPFNPTLGNRMFCACTKRFYGNDGFEKIKSCLDLYKEQGANQIFFYNAWNDDVSDLIWVRWLIRKVKRTI